MKETNNVEQRPRTSLSKGANAAISGIAGIGHIILGTGIILLIISLKKIAKKQE